MKFVNFVRIKMKVFGKLVISRVTEIVWSNLGLLAIASATSTRERQVSLNLRGRCGFGQPCDQNRLSYGCEKINDKLGFCWSECVGNMPNESEIGSFVYEGWCYNINSNLIPSDLMASFFSGKVARVSRSTETEGEDPFGYQEYFDNVSI